MANTVSTSTVSSIVAHTTARDVPEAELRPALRRAIEARVDAEHALASERAERAADTHAFAAHQKAAAARVWHAQKATERAVLERVIAELATLQAVESRTTAENEVARLRREIASIRRTVESMPAASAPKFRLTADRKAVLLKLSTASSPSSIWGFARHVVNDLRAEGLVSDARPGAIQITEAGRAALPAA